MMLNDLPGSISSEARKDLRRVLVLLGDIVPFEKDVGESLERSDYWEAEGDLRDSFSSEDSEGSLRNLKVPDYDKLRIHLEIDLSLLNSDGLVHSTTHHIQERHERLISRDISLGRDSIRPGNSVLDEVEDLAGRIVSIDVLNGSSSHDFSL